jgi:hypothetical protein
MQCAECPIPLGKFATKGTRGRVRSPKLLARRAPLSQARAAMSSFARLHNCGRALVAAFLSAAVLWTLALSVSPQLHARIHADANRAEHSCAVTLITTGGYEHATQPPLITGPQFTPCFSKIEALTSTWVRPLFLCAHIFAHAPPGHS